MKKIPLTMQQLLNEYEKQAPAMSWGDKQQSCIGIVHYFDFEPTRLRVKFKWLVIGQRKLFFYHTTIFKNPVMLDKGDFLIVRHDGSNPTNNEGDVIVTNLASFKSMAHIGKTRCEKLEEMQREIIKAKNNHH